MKVKPLVDFVEKLARCPQCGGVMACQDTCGCIISAIANGDMEEVELMFAARQALKAYHEEPK